jgi:ribose 5-phosphate isomerase
VKKKGSFMTDRYNALTEILTEDTRDDDAKALISAIRQLKGVVDVKGNVSNPSDIVEQTRVRRELAEALFKVIYPDG